MRKFLWILGTVVALLVIFGGSTWWASKQVPDFYAAALAEELAPEERKAAAKEFVQQTLRIVEDVEFSDRWAEQFEQDQINSWLAEELPLNYPELVPEGVSDPRVGLSDGELSLGFHFSSDAWAGVVSIRVRPWVSEPNELAIEILSIRAGLVPIPLDQLLHDVAAEVETEGLPIRWMQRNGHDVAIVSFETGPNGPVLEELEVTKGRIRASGKGAAKESPVGPGTFQVSDATER